MRDADDEYGAGSPASMRGGSARAVAARRATSPSGRSAAEEPAASGGDVPGGAGRSRAATAVHWSSRFQLRGGSALLRRLGASSSDDNIASKSRADLINAKLTQKPTTYDLAIDYSASRPHQIERIAPRHHTYDLNGNFTGWTDEGTERTVASLGTPPTGCASSPTRGARPATSRRTARAAVGHSTTLRLPGRAARRDGDHVVGLRVFWPCPSRTMRGGWSVTRWRRGGARQDEAERISDRIRATLDRAASGERC